MHAGLHRLRIPHSGFGQIEALTDMRLRMHHMKSGPDLIPAFVDEGPELHPR